MVELEHTGILISCHTVADDGTFGCRCLTFCAPADLLYLLFVFWSNITTMMMTTTTHDADIQLRRHDIVDADDDQKVNALTYFTRILLILDCSMHRTAPQRRHREQIKRLHGKASEEHKINTNAPV